MSTRNAAAVANYTRGVQAAKAAFAALPDIVRDRLLVAVETTVREIARQAQAQILASPSVRTRALHDHIGWSVSKTSGRGRVGVSAGSTVMKIGSARVRVRGIVVPGRGGSAAKAAGAKNIRPSRYAHLVEFGSRKMPAEPFMMPAVAREQGPFLQRCIQAGKGIEQDCAAIGGRTL